MNYRRQNFFITKALQKKGFGVDKVDLFSRIDRQLSYKENRNIILKRLGMNDNKITGRLSSYELYGKAQEYHNTRSNRSQRQDSRMRAKNTFYPDSITHKEFKKWTRHPNQYDIEGVDTRGGMF
jgi:hypothetical protein